MPVGSANSRSGAPSSSRSERPGQVLREQRGAVEHPALAPEGHHALSGTVDLNRTRAPERVVHWDQHCGLPATSAFDTTWDWTAGHHRLPAVHRLLRADPALGPRAWRTVGLGALTRELTEPIR